MELMRCTGLSPEQLLALRSVVKDSGTGVQGHSRSPVENARALLHINSYQQQGMSYVQTREAMECVTAELCQKQTRHCHTWIEQLMQSEEGGSLQQFGTLQSLLPLAAALIHTEAVDPLPAPPGQDDEEEEEQQGWTQ